MVGMVAVEVPMARANTIRRERAKACIGLTSQLDQHLSSQLSLSGILRTISGRCVAWDTWNPRRCVCQTVSRL